MTVRELINALLESNMDSDVKVVLNFDDAHFLVDEEIVGVNETIYNFENATLQIDIDCDYVDWIEKEEA